MGKNSPAKIAANNRYIEKTYDRFTFRVRKEETEIIRSAAAAAGMTVNSFILEAVREKISGSGPPEIEREPFFD